MGCTNQPNNVSVKIHKRAKYEVVGKIDIRNIKKFLVEHPRCYAIKKHIINEGEVGMNVNIYYTNPNTPYAFIRGGKATGCIFPEDGSLELGKKVFLVTLEEFTRQSERRTEINKARKEKLEKQAWQKDYKHRLACNSTQYERVLYKYLKNSGLHTTIERQYTFKYGAYHARAYFFDLYLPDYRIAIEVDGEYHNENTQQMKDRRRDYIVMQHEGVQTFRISNEDVMDPQKLCGFVIKLKHYMRLHDEHKHFDGKRQKLRNINKTITQ